MIHQKSLSVWLILCSFVQWNYVWIQLFSPLQWLNVKGGSGSYVNKVLQLQLFVQKHGMEYVIWPGFVYKQVREELESMGCQIKTGCKVRSVSRLKGGRSIVPYLSTCISGDSWVFDMHSCTYISIFLFAFLAFLCISSIMIIDFKWYYILFVPYINDILS